MRIAGATSVARIIFAGLSLILIALSGPAPARAGTIVREIYPQDELHLDLILRSSRDPDLLTPRQAALQARLRRMGVDALEKPVRPDIGTAASAWLDMRVRRDRWAPPRTRIERRWDRRGGLLVTLEISEGVLFSDTVDTNVAGVAIRTPPRLDQPGVEVRIDAVDAFITASTAVALDQELSLQLKNRQAAQAGTGELLNFTIPIRLPRTLERIIGKGEATNIRISGTERISIGGQSTVSDNFVASELRQNQSLFPQLEFTQSLRVNLDGTVGEKIKVRISHDSEAIGAQSTEVKLSFEGDEDDIIRTIRAGDIDVTLPGSRLLGVGTGRGGLFGLKVEGALGPVEFTVVTSKENAQQGNQTFSQAGGSDAQQAFQIRSVDYIPSRFFRLTAPVSYYFTDPDSFSVALRDSSLARVRSEQNLGAEWEIDYESLQVYRTIGAGLSQNETIDDAVAYLDPTGIGFEGFGAGANLTPGDSGPTSGDPLDSGFDPAVALDLDSQYRERWERLRSPEDWGLLEVNGQIIGIQLARPATDNEVIAVSYDIVDAVTGELVRRVGRSSEEGEDARIDDPATPGRRINYFKILKPGAPLSQPYENGAYTTFALCWEYEYRNFYDLQGREIAPEGFEFRIVGNDATLDPPDRDPNSNVRFIRIFGLDQQNKNQQQTPDGLADVENQNLFYLTPGFLRFEHPTPMNLPDSVVTAYTDGAVTSIPLGGRAPTLYTRILTSQERTELNRFNFEGSQSSVSSRLRLNAFNILENSEELFLDGELQVRGQDYDIDYLSGEINLKGDALARLNSQTRIEVRYESDPLFGGGRTSLSGANLQWKFGQSNLLSTTWLYQTRPNNQTKIRLGEEPTQNLVGNFQTKLRFQPRWVRPISNFISREEVRQDAALTFDAEVAMSIPDPNTKGTAYLDDFENADQSTQIPMVRQGWWWASLPVRGPDETGVQREAFSAADRAYQGWHRGVPSVSRSDLNPDLSEAESREIYTTLELVVAAKDPAAGWADDEFAGIMRGLGEVDLTRAQFLEFWIDDGSGYIDPSDDGAIQAGRPGRVHFDFGQINEDFFWQKDAGGEYILGQWDKEDSDNDGLLGLAEDGLSEDRGLDRLLNSQESPTQALPGRPSRAPDDPAGDDYDAVDTGDNKFIYINGTEGNERLDSEDFSFNNALDLADGFFRVTLELDDNAAFVDPARDYADNPGFIADMREEGRSWRKYRLDLRKLVELRRGEDANDNTPYGPATPDLSRVRTLRIWYEPEGDGTDPAERRLRFAEMRFLGNRWVAEGIRDPYDQVLSAAADTVPTQEFRLGVLNNKENADYIPPIGVRVRNNVAELEQALQFTYNDLQPGNRFRARKDLSGRIGEDYLQYGELNFFWRVPYRDGVPDATQTEAEGYFWIGSDSTSYYEIAVPFDRVQADGAGWVDVSIALADLSNVKNAPLDSLVAYPDTIPGARPNPEVRREQVMDTHTGNVYDVTVRGRPDLRRVQRYYVGVRYRQPDPALPPPPPYSGEVLFNELRLREVNRKVGFAQRYAGTLSLPGIGDVAAEFSNTDEEFRGLDQDRGREALVRAWAIRGSSRLQNFVPLGGLDIPIQVSHRVNEELPKFEPRSDIELEPGQQERFISRTVSQNFSIQFRKLQPSNRWWLKYSLDPFSYQMSGSRTVRTQPEQDSNQDSLDWAYNYDLNLRSVPSLPVPFTRSRLTWLPNQLTLGSRWTANRQKVTAKNLAGEPLDSTIENTRSMVNDATVRWRPFESIPTTWTLGSTRNLLLAQNEVYREALGDGRWMGINIGFEEQRREGATLQYRPNFRWLQWARPNIEYRASYGENRRPGIRQKAQVVGDPQLDPDGDSYIGVPTEVRNLSNSRDVSVRAELGLVGWVRRFMNTQSMARAGGFRQTDAADSTATQDEGGGIPDVLGKTLKGLSRAFWDMRPISLNLQHKRTSAYQHVNGRADYAYRLGFTNRPDFSGIEALPIRREADNTLVTQDFSVDQRVVQRNLRLSTQTNLADPLRLDASFNWRRNTTESEARGDGYDRSIEWPNLTLRIQQVHEWRVFKWMGSPLESSDMSLAWKESESARGKPSDPREYPTRRTSWQPRWNARLRNGMDTSLNLSRTSEVQESAGQGALNRSTTNVTLRLDKQFDARGRMSFLRFGQSGVGSTIDMTLSLTWGTDTSWRERDGIRSQERSSTRISVDPQFTYQFTRNLRGSLRLQYSRSAQTTYTSQSLGVFFDAVLNF